MKNDRAREQNLRMECLKMANGPHIVTTESPKSADEIVQRADDYYQYVVYGLARSDGEAGE